MSTKEAAAVADTFDDSEISGPLVSGRGWWRLSAIRTLLGNRRAIVGLVILVFMVLFSFIGPLFYKTNQVSTNLYLVNKAPSVEHLLGTDPSGYDILGRLMLGGQSTLEIGFVSAIIASTVGTLWGVAAGFAGGWVDAAMMRVVDSMLAVPALLLVLVVASIYVATVPVLIAIIALVSWLFTARLTRGQCLSLREREYVAAAISFGSKRKRIVFRHLIPNLMDIVVVQASLEMANAVLLLAALSYLGLGPPAPSTNWGDMLGNGLDYIDDGYWWLIYPAGIAIVLTVIGLNMVGDALRDALDVRLQEVR